MITHAACSAVELAGGDCLTFWELHSTGRYWHLNEEKVKIN